MSDSEAEQPPEQPKPEQHKDDPSRGDYLALGIGCAVFIIMFVAVVMVGIMRGE